MSKLTKKYKQAEKERLKDLYIKGIRRLWEMNPSTRVIPNKLKEAMRRKKVTQDDYDY